MTRQVVLSVVVSRSWSLNNLLLLFSSNDEPSSLFLRRLVGTRAWLCGGRVCSKQIYPHFLGADFDVGALVVAHVIQGVLVLPRAWVHVFLGLELGAHVSCTSFSVSERRCVF